MLVSSLLALPLEEIRARLPGFLASYVTTSGPTRAEIIEGVSEVRRSSDLVEWEALLARMHELGADFGFYEANPLAARTRSPRLAYLRVLSGNMVRSGLAPLEPPRALLEELPFPLAPLGGITSGPLVRLTVQGSVGGRTSSLGIIFTVWNCMMGSTLLVMPYTFQQAGWLLSLVVSLVRPHRRTADRAIDMHGGYNYMI